MADLLTIAEIQSQFTSEWVLVEDPQTNDALAVLSGTRAAIAKIAKRCIGKR